MQRIVSGCFLFFLVFVSLNIYADFAPDNIALRAHTWASSELMPAKNAVDGDNNTRWESQHNIDLAWLAIDLGKEYELSRIMISWEAANAKIYEVQGSNDKDNWQTISRQTNGAFGNRLDDMQISGRYRYVRILCITRSEGNHWGYSIWEVNIAGKVPGETQIIALNANASSEIQAAQNAIDFNPATRWESEHSANTAWLEINFGREYNLANIIIDWEVANAKVYEVQGLSGNNNWVSLARVENGTIGNRRDNLSLNGNYRQIRINCLEKSEGNLWGYSIWNISINAKESVTYQPLFDNATALEPETVIDTNDALITRFSDRGRDRHAREAQFKAYDHYLSFYWEHRTIGIEVIDEVAKGGNKITFNVTTQWPLNAKDFRAFFRGVNTVAEYYHNVGLTPVVNEPLKYYTVLEYNPKEGRGIQKGDRIEIEISQFLDNPPEGRENYYGTTFLYIAGVGLKPWFAQGPLLDSYPLPEETLLGGMTTIHEQYSDEPLELLKQMATNTAPQNAQVFMHGRRIHLTDFQTGEHSEPGNPVFSEFRNKLGERFINKSCIACHVNNGRGKPPQLGVNITNAEVRVADSSGNAHPLLGNIIQTQSRNGAPESTVKIAAWQNIDGLRSPVYEFSPIVPEKFSARMTPQLVGLGLLEAIAESDIEAIANLEENRGRMHIVTDAITGEKRIGRFGLKAQRATLREMIAGALNVTMGVTTSIFPKSDCGSENPCESPQPMNDADLDVLVKYNALLGVRAQRNANDAKVKQGREVFDDIGCAVCHTPTFKTSPFHPYAELRNQTIHPYTDLLLHDMGPLLADNLGEGDASGAEWRTAPLWNIGLVKKVGQEESYLHDGRARTLNEAILYHGGQGEDSRTLYTNLSADAKDALIKFLQSL